MYEKEGDDAGLELTQEVIFDICFTHQIVLAAVSHIFGSEFKTNSLNYMDALPHYGLQRLHPDCNALWLIDPHTGENGSTRLVPRSHLSGQHSRKAMANYYDPHPNEIILNEQAGTVVICNAHIWHGGTCNTSGERRRTMHASFIKREFDQQLTERHFKQHTTRNI